tara:strand:- start:112 stop:831 length:720 start_codon:yes stop_codon:yes gene_type:complete
MTKKIINQKTKYDEEIINSIESDFIFNDNPINRFKVTENHNETSPISKIYQIAELKKKINSIENCNLKNNSNSLIIGEGNINSSIMIIGEAPNTEEDISGTMHKGEAGDLLNRMLLAIDIKRDNVYTSYAINYKTPEDRKPTSQEIKRYSFFLKKHVSIINPKIVVAMGSTAMESLTGLNNKISSERGEWKEIIIENITYPIMITFNPSYLIRFPDNKKNSWEDLKKIKQKICELNLKH